MKITIEIPDELIIATGEFCESRSTWTHDQVVVRALHLFLDRNNGGMSEDSKNYLKKQLIV